MNEVVRRSGKPKVIGDTTSITIPTKYIDLITGDLKEVTPELLNRMNAALSDRELVHLFFTGIAVVDSLGSILTSFEDLERRFKNVGDWKRSIMAEEIN